jgi:hypothetical protein
MTSVGLSPEAVAAADLRALEGRYHRARSWASGSLLAAELRLDAAEVGRAVAAQGRRSLARGGGAIVRLVDHASYQYNSRFFPICTAGGWLPGVL